MSLAHRLNHYFLPHHSNNQKARFLHPSPVLFFAGIFSLFQLLLSHPQISPRVLSYASSITAPSIVEITNRKRVELGIPALKVDTALEEAARSKAYDMLSKNYWAHVSPTGTEPWFFITQARYNYLLAGENLARDFNDSQGVVTAWLNSPSHRENLLNPRYQDIGVAAVNGTLGTVPTTLVVQMFGTRLSREPEVVKPAAIVREVLAESEANIPSPLPTLAAEDSNSGQSATAADSTPRVLINPFMLTRAFASFILILLISLLLVDAVIIWRRKIVRLSSDSASHLAFLTAITIAIWVIRSGIIL